MPSKDFKKFKKDFVSPSILELKKTLEKKTTDPVNLEEGTIKYDAVGYKKATKYCFLRAVQYSLDLIIYDFIRKEKNNEIACLNLLKNKPRSVTQLIDFLKENNLLNASFENNSEQLKANYELVLTYFHITQLLYTYLETPPCPITIHLGEVQKNELINAFKTTLDIIRPENRK